MIVKRFYFTPHICCEPLSSSFSERRKYTFHTAHTHLNQIKIIESITAHKFLPDRVVNLCSHKLSENKLNLRAVMLPFIFKYEIQ